MKYALNVFFRLVGAGLFILSLYMASYGEKTEVLWNIFQLTSFLMILTAIVSVFFLSYQVEYLIDIIRVFLVSTTRLKNTGRQLRSDMSSLIDNYYQDGPSNTADRLSGRKLPYAWYRLRQTFEQFVSAEDGLFIIRQHMHSYVEKLNYLKKICTTLSNIAPSMGVLGTVIGLIQLLSQLEDFNSLGKNMSLALLTTLYGLIFSSFVFKPVAQHIENLKESELEYFRDVSFFLDVISSKKPSMYVDK